MIRAVALAALVVAATAASTPPPAFRHARPVLPGGPGPNRLAVDAPLLTGARPLRFDATGRYTGGLDDLRLASGDGREIPYLVLAPPASERTWRGGTLRAIAAGKDESGFEVDLAEVVTVDRIRLSGLAAPVLKRARLEGSGDRERWVLLADATSIFNLPDEGLRRLEVGFAPEPLRFVRVVWDDRATSRVALPATVALRTAAAASPPPVLVPVAFERRTSEPGTSRFRILLPGPGLPIRAFELDVVGDHLLRRARVLEARLTGDAVTPRELGASVLRRVTRTGVTASDLRVPVATPHDLQVELVVDDGDNPPLALRGIATELPPLPTIWFDSPDAAALTAKFGSPTLSAPRYDLEAARASLANVGAATATWGERTSLPAPSAAGDEISAAAMPTPGAPIDLGTFRWVRRLPPGPGGLTALRLDAAVLAHSAALADVRLVNPYGRQIPYVVEHVGEPLVVPLPGPLSEPTPDGEGRSRGTTHRVQLPYRRLPDARLVLETSARVFERRVVVRAESRTRARPHAERTTVATVAWRHADPTLPGPTLTIPLPPLDDTTLWIEVDDGDNRPLPITAVRLLLPTRRLRFVRAPGTDPVLAYGAPGLAAPRYDLSLLAPRILGARAHEIEALPEATAGTVPDDGPEVAERRQRRVFWVVLGVSVAVLIGVLVRLLRVEGRAGAA